MGIFSFDVAQGRAVDAYGSVGLTAQKQVRGDVVEVTVLHVAAGGQIGLEMENMPATVA